MPIAAVYFDIGKTLVDRTREYAAIARELNVSPHTFSAVLGATIVRGGGINETFAHFGIDRAAARAFASVPALAEVDLYPGARDCLQRLRDQGLLIGIVGNQAAGVADELRALELPADVIATSDEWGVAKPAPAFFAAVVESAGVPAAEIVYVGDQLDNDVVAAADAGLQVVRVLTGPWGELIRDREAEARCLAVVDDLTGLAELLAARR